MSSNEGVYVTIDQTRDMHYALFSLCGTTTQSKADIVVGPSRVPQS